MDMTRTPLGWLVKVAAEVELPVGKVEGEPEWSGNLSAPVAKQWAKNTLAVTGGLGLGLLAGEGLRHLYRKSPLYERFRSNPEWAIRVMPAAAGAAATWGYMVRKQQRELLRRAEEKARGRAAGRASGPQG